MIRKSSAELMSEAVERALARWKIPSERKFCQIVPTPVSPTPPFTIAISRQAGARGADVARATGERLGWPVYDRELLEKIARELGLHPESLEGFDEKRVGWLREFMESFSSQPSLSQIAYIHHMVEVLISLAADGNCVIVGRGAAQILPEPTTLRVRMVGPRPLRIASIQERMHLDGDAAARWVDVHDRERSLFVKEHFNKDPDDASLYDLVLNSNEFTDEGCIEMILAALTQVKAARARRLGAKAGSRES